VDGDVIRLFQRVGRARIIALSAVILGGVALIGSVACGWYILGGFVATSQVMLFDWFFLPTVGLWNLLLAAVHVGIWVDRRRRRPRWIIGTDRIVYVENESDELAEIPYAMIDRVELPPFDYRDNIRIILREPLDWCSHLPRRIWPVVRKMARDNWAIEVQTTREPAAVILGLLQERLTAFRNAHEASVQSALPA
jgi:hypothetical protein